MVSMRKTTATKDPRVLVARAGRLYRLIRTLANGPRSRTHLLRALKVGMRTFYRDVDLLRESGIRIEAKDATYILADLLEVALHRLPFPDPQLTFGEAQQLAKGRTKAHAKLKQILDRMTR
jgi:hypothetical protein